MIRSAAKNFKYVTVICNPDNYEEVIDELKLNDGGISYKTRKKLMTTAFNITADSDSSDCNSNGQAQRRRIFPFIIY